ncbi:unnamed protein product [Cuscuta campestris]|uniref:BED-type domain-containing protein n=1 Tax=Cuscuta campestris TaxID=132261 RepID=A0A484MDT3_9ASTE|nr:unnamed protein product [Cuscuta campestris]
MNSEKDQTTQPTQIVEESQKTALEKDENEEYDDRKRSFVWDHFKYAKNITSARCPYCKRMIKCDSKKNGTSGLGKHLKMYCRKSPCYKQPDMKQKTLSFTPPQPSSRKSDVKGNMYNQEGCRMALARMCIKDNRPFSIVEDEGFKKMKYVELCLKKNYENNGEKQAMFLQRVGSTLDSLYKEYLRLASSGDVMGGSTSSSVAPISLDIDDDDFLEKEFERDLLVAQGKENKSEIDIYLSDDILQVVDPPDITLDEYKKNLEEIEKDEFASTPKHLEEYILDD